MNHLFSTKRFVPGHILGTAVLLFGTIGMAKLLIRRAEEQKTEACFALKRPSRYGAR